jgi:hypothetical protein
LAVTIIPASGGPLHDVAPHAQAAALYAIGDVLAASHGKFADQFLVDGLHARVNRERNRELFTVDPAELLDPATINRERIVEEDHIGQGALTLNLQQLVDDAVDGPASAVVRRLLVQFVVHTRSAICAWKRAASLRGHVDAPRILVEHVARHEVHVVQGLERRPQSRPRAAGGPDVIDT